MPTISEAITEGARRLRAAGIDSERLTASLLLCHELGIDRPAIFAQSERMLTEQQLRLYLDLIERRCSGEPLQYITGHQEFYGLDFLLTPDVLIPRPETEYLVEQIMKLAGRARHRDTESDSCTQSKSRPRGAVESGSSKPGSGPLIADIGTGSGCIAVALAVNLGSATVIATDISPAALAVARANAQRHGVADRIEFREGDLVDPLYELGLERSLDFLASNPPYVPSGQPGMLQREVRDWEPPLALFGGELGVGFYGRLLSEGAAYVKPGGYLVCEIGYSQLDAVKAMIDDGIWELAEVTSDLQGILRTLTLRRLSNRDQLDRAS